MTKILISMPPLLALITFYFCNFKLFCWVLPTQRTCIHTVYFHVLATHVYISVLFTKNDDWIFPRISIKVSKDKHFQIRNYLIAAGMKTVGISAAGGVGLATAELIVNKDTDYDMYEIEVSRFLGLHNNRKFLRDRVKEVPGMHYGLSYPFHEFSTGRNLRMSPVYPKLREAGAVFGQVMGYERPTWFDKDHITG